jgi:glutamate--cysteine ligase
LQELALDILPLARAGLARRARLDASGRDETLYLAPLEEIAASGRNLAEARLALYHGGWGSDLARTFTDCVY